MALVLSTRPRAKTDTVAKANAVTFRRESMG
jgi:hypothetical protein